MSAMRHVSLEIIVERFVFTKLSLPPPKNLVKPTKSGRIQLYELEPLAQLGTPPRPITAVLHHG